MKKLSFEETREVRAEEDIERIEQNPRFPFLMVSGHFDLIIQPSDVGKESYHLLHPAIRRRLKDV